MLAGSLLARRVLLLGATGATGGELVKALTGADYAVTALARSGTAGLPTEQVLRGDVLDAAGVERAVDGQAVVVWAVGGHDAIRTFLARKKRQRGLCRRGTENVIAAMRKHGVQRLIAISSWGVADGRGRLPFPFRVLLPLMMSAELKDKADQEALVRASSLDWTIVRPARLKPGASPGLPMRSGEELAFTRSARVYRADLARFVTSLVRDRASHRTVLELSQ